MFQLGRRFILTLLVLAAFRPVVAQEIKLGYHGAGWLQLGRVESSYSLPNNGNDYKKNWLGNAGAVLKSSAVIDENWEGDFGVGTIMVHLARGSLGQANKWYPFWVPFISEAKLTYSSDGFSESRGFQLNFGSMEYSSNPDVKNLGMYLLHGYVYPGTLVLGLSDPLGVLKKINGFVGKARFGDWQNDLIVNMETEDKPFYDISLGNLVTYTSSHGFEISAGINFSRLLPMNGKITSPGKDCDPNFLGPYANRGQDNPCFIITKNASGDSTGVVLGSLGGVKTVGRVRVDPKVIFSDGASAMGKDDLVLYSEVGIIGVKNYPQLYDKILRRMPVMFGFNFPGFNYLKASLEVEYYANKLSGDNIAARSGSWVSVVDDPRINTKRDDWKWSFNVSKVLVGNLNLATQLANDHLRLGGNHDQDAGIEAMRTPSDWYWTAKLAYFF